MSGLSREELVAQLSEITGQAVTMAAYKKWETRTLLPHQFIIAFCDITGTDPYMLLTGTPFRIGRKFEGETRQAPKPPPSKQH